MTTDRHDPDATSELDDEFWGEQTEWTHQPQRSAERSGVGATIARWWDGLLGGRVGAERAHGRARISESPSEVPHGPVDHQHGADEFRPDHVEDESGGDDTWTLEPEPQAARRPGADPLLARLGGLAVIVTLATPLLVGFAASRSDSQFSESMLSTISSAPSAESAASTTTVVAPDPASASTGTDPTTAGSTSGPVASESTTSEPPAAPVSAAAASLEVVPAPESTGSAEATPTAPTNATAAPCGNRYDLAAGDYWIRIADAAGVSLADLLAVNNASVDTVLSPGRSICLPVGASTPSPPAPVTAAPAPARTAPATKAAPRRPTATTVAPAPTTTASPRTAAVPESQAAAIIRDVWPDELEERALEIAWRESNHRSNVNNWCCYGLFQINWNAHRSWLSALGVTSASQLYDPVVNTNAAYMLYQRSGGFGPWGG